jgi:hypothetical protein
MRAQLARFSFVIAALLLAVVMLAESRHAPPARTDAVAAEVERIRAHLARVEAELESADVSHLNPAQRAMRSWNIATLRRYRDAGKFPHNHVVRDRRLPVFVDEHGTLCAVGYLIARSGRMDLVRRIARSRNYATVPELADDAELAAWLRGAGLSVAEAARIQPSYGPIPDPDRARADPDYATATALAAGLSGGVIAWNLLRERPGERPGLPGALGVAVGLGDLALVGIGIARDSDGREVEPAHIAINFGLGLVSGALGLRTLLATRPPAASSDTQAERGALHLSAAPWTPPGRRSAGLRLRLRF